MFRFGIDRLIDDPSLVRGGRVALLTHPAAVTSTLQPAWQALADFPGIKLVRLFGPEHGIDGSAQDMASVGSGIHAPSGLPAKSLYGSSIETLSPAPGDLADVDAVVCDLQDVGSRYYTFVWTLCRMLDECGKLGKRVVVLDRPNPLGSAVEGEPQRADHLSFVGHHPVPVRHGLTIGEMASLYRGERSLDVDLSVIPMSGWGRDDGWPAARGWVPPSPNIPTVDTARVYPGMCLLEATNLSEGRGTTRPFEQAGAPFLDAETFGAELNSLGLPGVQFRPVHFRPTFHKHADQTCGGVFLHVVDPGAFRPYETGLRVVETARRLAPAEFSWRRQPYEFETRLGIDLLTGSPEFRDLLESGAETGAFYKRQRDVIFQSDRVHLYPETRPALVGISGTHNSGKTTLIERLVPILQARGLSVGSVKHTPHDVDDDAPGKDSHRHFASGANPSAFLRPSASTIRIRAPRKLQEIVDRDFSECDIVLVEGFQSLPVVRISVGAGAPFRVEFLGSDFTADLPGLAEAVIGRLRLGPR